MDKNLKAKQFNRAIQKLIQSSTLTDSEVLEYTEIYPTFEVLVVKAQSLPIGTILSYGKNSDDETQLYSVLQEHMPQINWKPDVSASLYKKIGFAEDDTPIWTQPLGASDAYMKGDVVSHKDKLWISTVDNNVWEPGVYGWKEKK